jgi:hypothetical protein
VSDYESCGGNKSIMICGVGENVEAFVDLLENQKLFSIMTAYD